MNEVPLMEVAIVRKLKSILVSIKSTDDIGEKIELLMKGLHIPIGGRKD